MLLLTSCTFCARHRIVSGARRQVRGLSSKKVTKVMAPWELTPDKEIPVEITLYDDETEARLAKLGMYSVNFRFVCRSCCPFCAAAHSRPRT